MNAPPAPEAAPDPLQEALALHRKGQHELAMQRYVAILQRDPNHADALYYVAVLALQEGQIAEGIKVIGRALDVRQPQARFHNLLGQAHLRQNQDHDALTAFGRAIETDAGFADAYGNRGTLLAEMKRLPEALADFDRALKLRPDNPADLCNRAGVLSDLGRLDEALMGFDRALTLMPQLAPAFYNRAEVKMKLGRFADALADYDRAIAIFPGMAGAHSNRGLTLKAMGRLDEARASIERALSIDPNNVEAIANRGNVSYEQGRLDEAIADYDRALKVRPDFAEANHGRALASLTLGDWETGFRLYDYRDRLKASAHKSLPHPRWSGETVPGERLLLLCEQGLGDMIMFSRFAPLIARRGIDVTLLAPAPMRRLLSTLDGVTVAGLDDAPPVNGHPVRWLPLMSAPGALGIRPDNVPAPVPYLAAEPARVEHWAASLGSDGFKIGINWGLGVERDWFGRIREVPLSAFAPLADIPGVRLVSLQKGPPLSDIARVPFGARIDQPGDNFDAGAEAFLDTAALMMSLDLVVTCDTSIAHLAGALGRPVFTALPSVADWRWLRKRGDTPWYPTMRLFRQSQPGDWREPFARIAAAAGEMVQR
jgi:tetratricopeptide (TPR) repeat protein